MMDFGFMHLVPHKYVAVFVPPSDGRTFCVLQVNHMGPDGEGACGVDIRIDDVDLASEAAFVARIAPSLASLDKLMADRHRRAGADGQ